MTAAIETAGPVGINPEDTAAWQDTLVRAGAIGNSAFGVQFDLNAAWRHTEGKVLSASFCDHNCTTEVGNYTCLASSTLNVGVRPSSLTPAETILDSFGTLSEGIDAARADFFDGPFQAYSDTFNIPAAVATAMRASLDRPGFEVNLFGGNPELHPEVTTIIRELRGAGHDVHLTTTGGRFMRDANFLEQIVEHPPTLLALSADDFEGAEDIQHLAGLSLDELRAAWKAVPRLHGQRRKAHEAIYAAKLARNTEGFPKILFNMVLHPGNIANASSIVGALTTEFPDVIINPFPAQSAFSYDEEPALRVEHATALRDIIDRMIALQASAVQAGTSTAPYAPRLHYWLMLRAAFDIAGDDPAQAMNMITGDGIWQCYRDSPAGFYTQVGLGPEGEVRSSANQHPGGCLGCFWNKQTVTDNRQVWGEAVTPPIIARYIKVGKPALAAESARPCPGCAFPRLVGHMISAETGMDPRLLPAYFDRRKQTLGF
ncbi:MAG TPA: radical SAM protein [Patescibacteria group bacterium]|nr:radical SAM protein [Patescibacteria group bacterium]